MNELIQNETPSNDNVIEVKFTEHLDLKFDQIRDEVLDNLGIDDPLDELLNEFSDLTEEDLGLPNLKDRKLFLNEPDLENISFDMNLRYMGLEIEKQITQLKTRVKRLKFYLDEMNLDS